MSLQIWLPLNKDLRNLGTKHSTVTSTNATLNTNGKLGGCYSFNGSSSYLLGTQDFISNDIGDWSFACWMKINATSAGCLFSCRTSSTYTGITIFYYGSQWLIDDGVRWTLTPTVTIATNTWYHICIVRKKGVGKYLYVNGALDSSTTTTGTPTIISTTNYSIGGSQGTATSVTGNFLNGYLNDVRFYNNALSVAEIKELSKGLVCHYKLDTPFTITNLARNSTYVSYNNYSGSGSTATLTDTGRRYNGCKIYRLTYTPNDTSLNHVRTALTSHGIYGFRTTFSANTKYCFWILWKAVSHPDTVCGGTASNIQGWTEIPTKKYDNEWNIVGQYRNGSVTTDKTDYIFTSFKTPSATSGTPITIDFCCPHLVSGYDYILPEYDYLGTDPNISDSTGHGYTATKSGTVTVDSSTPRYSLSTKFTSGSHVYTPALSTGGFTNTYTFSWWAKYTNYSSHMMWGFSNGNRLNLYMTSSIFCWNTGDGGSNTFNVSAATYGDNNWHHFAVTGDGTTTKLYIDGEFKANAKTYKGITGTTIYMNGWDSGTSYNFNGQLSDFRLYATCLSADDIKRLYNTAASVAKNGSMLGYEVKEG